MLENDCDKYISAGNLEVALASYFDLPSKEEAEALRILNASLQRDQAIYLCANKKGARFGN